MLLNKGKFGYSSNCLHFSKHAVPLQEVARLEDPQVEVNVSLPYLGEPLILTVKVCNDYNVCDYFEDPSPIQVNMPTDFTVNDIRCHCGELT
jgi:hypothetical protein